MDGNTISGSNVGVNAFSDTGVTTISNNNVSGANQGAVSVDTGDYNITTNTIHDNTSDGIDLFDSQNGSAITANSITNSTVISSITRQMGLLPPRTLLWRKNS